MSENRNITNIDTNPRRSVFINNRKVANLIEMFGGSNKLKPANQPTVFCLPVKFDELTPKDKAKTLIAELKKNPKLQDSFREYCTINKNFLFSIADLDYIAMEIFLVNSETNSLLTDDDVAKLLYKHRVTIYLHANSDLLIEAPMLDYLLSFSNRSLKYLATSNNTFKFFLKDSSSLKACLDFDEKTQIKLNETAKDLAAKNIDIYGTLNINKEDADHFHKILRAHYEIKPRNEMHNTARDILLNCIARNIYDTEIKQIKRTSKGLNLR